MVMFAKALRPSPPRSAKRDCLIVARDHAALYQALHELATDGKFTVVVDRRKADRRQRYQTVRTDRRRAERREQPAVAADASRRPFALVRERDRSLLD